MLNRRQVDVQRQNLATMCRISVKSLIDSACLNTHVDEDSEEFINFCAVFEQMVSHRLRPYQKRVWHRGQGTPRHFWEVLVENHNHTNRMLFNTCIPNIERIENIKSPKAKLRAFLRIALMEKRLSDYLYWVVNNSALIQECYMDGALFASEEGIVLCGDLIGLNAIDFNFCLKGNENELLGPLEINYAPFLRHKQSLASQCSDEEEMLRLSGKSIDNVNTSNSTIDSNETVKLQNLEKDFRSIKEQKEYLEELIRLRESQLTEARVKIETMRVSHEKVEKDWNKERKILDACILELQGSMSGLRIQNGHLKYQVSVLQQFKERLEMKDVPLMEMAYGPDERMFTQSSTDLHNQRGQSSMKASGNDTRSTLSDERSIQSSTSDQIRLKEDSHSMVPLTGSLADVNVAMLKDQPSEPRKEIRQAGGVLQVEKTVSVSVENVAVDSDQREELTEPVIASGITESYVMAEIVEEQTTPENTADVSDRVASTETEPSESDVAGEKNSEMCTDGNKSVHETEEASDDPLSSIAKDGAVRSEQSGIEQDVMTISDGGISTTSSGPEVLTSDPEILDRTNTSSEGSDAAWEMLSDAEQAEHSH